MKRGLVICLSVLFAVSCQKNDTAKRETDIDSIYKLVLARAKEYNGQNILLCADLMENPIDSNDLYYIKKGIKKFTLDIQEAIEDYNDPESAEASRKIVKGYFNTSKTSKKYQLSGIGFSNDGNVAVLYEFDNIDSVINHRSFLFFRKSNAGWMVESEIIMNN